MANKQTLAEFIAEYPTTSWQQGQAINGPIDPSIAVYVYPPYKTASKLFRLADYVVSSVVGADGYVLVKRRQTS